MQVPPSCLISSCNWRHLVVKFGINMQVVHPVAKLATNASDAIWLPNLQTIQVSLKSFSTYSSWEIYSRFGLNTLGPLCLWQCFEEKFWIFFILENIKGGRRGRSVPFLCGEKAAMCSHTSSLKRFFWIFVQFFLRIYIFLHIFLHSQDLSKFCLSWVFGNISSFGCFFFHMWI